MNNGIERGLAIAEDLKKFISNKFVCEIGCDNGDVLYGLSKYAKKAIGIEVNQGPYSEAKQVEYKCDTTIVHADAYSFLKENTHINPNVFYFWANYRKKTSGMQWWVERILELRGTTNPVIIAGLHLQHDSGLQLGSAREIQQIYGGDIIHTPFSVGPEIVNEFGLLVIQCNGQTVSADRAAPNIDRHTYDQTVTPQYEQWIRELSNGNWDSIVVDPNDL